MLIWIFCFLFVIPLPSAGSLPFSPGIETQYSVVQGRLIHLGVPNVGLDVYEFLGIQCNCFNLQLVFILNLNLFYLQMPASQNPHLIILLVRLKMKSHLLWQFGHPRHVSNK